MHDTGTSGLPFLGRWVGMDRALSVGIGTPTMEAFAIACGQKKETKNKNC